MKLTEVSLGFPVNQTIETQFENYADKVSCKKDTTYNYKLILHCSEEQRKQLTEQVVIDIFTANNPQTASVKVVFDVERTQHIRAPKIIQAKSNQDKLAEYLKVNELSVSDNIYSLEKEIEDSLEIKYSKPRHTFTLLKVFLRGSIGMHEKSGRDEFELDFEKYPDGIIALCAKIGSGKTTLLENCQPYPQMLTRSGKLQDHFYLRDSCRKLLYIDEEGTYYDIDIQIDGKNKSGKVKAFVKTGKSLDEMKDIPECDGNVDAYSKWVNDTFGTIELYLRTAFYTRGKTGSVPDIAYATKGEKKALFSTLIGIEGLSEISVAARECGKSVSKKKEQTEAKIVDLSEYESIDDIESEIDSLKKKVKKVEKDIQTSQQKLTSLEAENITDITEKIRELETQRDNLVDTRNDLESKVAFIKYYNENKDTLEKAKDIYEKLNLANKGYLTFCNTVFNPASEDYNKLREELSGKQHDYDILKVKYDTFKQTLADDINDTCPTCGQKLPESKITELTNLLSAEKVKLQDMERKLNGLKKEVLSLSKKEKSHKLHEYETKKREMEAEKEKLSDLITDGMPEEYDLVEIETQYKAIKNPDELSDKLIAVNKDIATLTEKIVKLSETDNSKVLKEIDEIKNYLDEQDELKKDMLIEIGKLTEQKKAITDTEKQNIELQHQVDDLNALEAQYSVLEKAFGANGIQALELEALSPEIADITNDVLETVFGGEYKISFQTLRVGSNGNLIEDFNILVETVSTGTIRPLEWVSGGEGTIIKEALYNAFSIARQKASGFSFRTKFMDEMDSAIDPEFRPKYLQMVKAVHEISGTQHTVMITHSSEIKDAVESKIEL